MSNNNDYNTNNNNNYDIYVKITTRQRRVSISIVAGGGEFQQRRRRQSRFQLLQFFVVVLLMMMMMMMMIHSDLGQKNHDNNQKNQYVNAYQPGNLNILRQQQQQRILQQSSSTTTLFQTFHQPAIAPTTSQQQLQRQQQQQQERHVLLKLFQSTSSSSVTVTSESPHSSSSSSSESESSSVASFFANDPNVQYIIVNPNVTPTDEWELDCYSRPVLMKDDNNKKLWQLLITDSIGSFRYIHRLPSNQVNSKTVRQVIDTLMDVLPSTQSKPNTIRFFRGAMFNMIQIALSELPNITSKPSRCTFALASWLEELYTNVYPNMEGYNPSMVQSSSSSLGNNAPSFLDVRTPIKLPDALRGEKYAFVSLPLQEFLLPPDNDIDDEGGATSSSKSGINADNIGVGRLCPIPQSLLSSSTLAAADTFVQGVVILSSRATALAAWLAGTEVVALQADLRKRILTMETDIDNQYLMAKLNDQQRIEAVAFEEGKDQLQGLHFISVQKTEDDDPEGFWLLRELPSGI